MEKEKSSQELLDNKKELIKKFLSLTEKQYKLLQENNYENIINIINEKQSVIERINIIDADLKNIRKENKSQEIVTEIKKLIEKALQIDKKNIEILKNNKELISERLKDARKNTKTHSLYRGKNVEIGGIMLDKKK